MKLKYSFLEKKKQIKFKRILTVVAASTDR